MYYKVLVASVNYINQSGQECRAMQDSIIYLEQRTEAKKMVKNKSLLRIPDESVTLGAGQGYVLIEDEPDSFEETKALPEKPKLKTNEGAQDDWEDNEQSDETPVKDSGIESDKYEPGTSVQALVNDEIMEGTIMGKQKDGKLKITFRRDTASFRRFMPEDVEVMG